MNDFTYIVGIAIAGLIAASVAWVLNERDRKDYNDKHREKHA